jgi:hypothetical protein
MKGSISASALRRPYSERRNKAIAPYGSCGHPRRWRVLQLRFAKEETTMPRSGAICLVVGVLCAAGGASAADWLKNQVIPNFAPTANTGWVLDHAVGVDDLLPPPTGGPGPVTFDKAHPYVPNGSASGSRAAGSAHRAQ